MEIGALIVAAGMSKRMGEFKPMLSIGSISVAQRVVATLSQAGVSKIVIFLSRLEESVRVAIMAGTVQPKPLSIGTKLRPESPIFRKSLSITKATLAIYPESSKMERKKK